MHRHYASTTAGGRNRVNSPGMPAGAFQFPAGWSELRVALSVLEWQRLAAAPSGEVGTVRLRRPRRVQRRDRDRIPAQGVPVRHVIRLDF